jgi:RNase P/RNase MRP subunit POP5
MWRTPGVEVRGWLQIADTLVADDNGAIDTLMGEIGADYMGARRTPGWAKPDRYFSFEVQSMASGQRMEAAVQTQMNKLYGGVRSADLVEAVGMYAVWRGT